MILKKAILKLVLCSSMSLVSIQQSCLAEEAKKNQPQEKSEKRQPENLNTKPDSKQPKSVKAKKEIAKGKDTKLVIPEQLTKVYGEENAKYVFLNSIIELIRQNHVVNYSRDELITKAIEGFLSNLDPHTCYLNEKYYKSLMEQTDGEFGGIGTEIILDSGLIRIITPIDDTPAYKAGIKPGDYILCINDEYISGISSEEAVEKLRGKPGTVVKLKIKRTGKDPFDVEIKRAIIKIQSVKSEYLNGVAYIRISTFDKNTTKDMVSFIEKIKKEKGKELKGVVLDLRNNPGGLLTEARTVSGAFLKGGVVVTTKGRDPTNYLSLNADGTDLLNGLPLAVIVNSGTASAAEIVAGALQDHKRAVVVGVRTFGKGSVQQVVPLSKTTGMKVTVAMHYRPSGICIQGHGITPDIEVNPAVISEFKELTCLREENIKHSIGGKSDGSPELIETNDQKALSKTEKPETTLDKVINSLKNLFTKEEDKKNLDKIKSKLEQLNSKKKSDTELEDEFDELYRSRSITERLEKDLQLRTAFCIIQSADVISKLSQTSKNK